MVSSTIAGQEAERASQQNSSMSAKMLCQVSHQAHQLHRRVQPGRRACIHMQVDHVVKMCKDGYSLSTEYIELMS
jgi:hypothetical protein